MSFAVSARNKPAAARHIFEEECTLFDRKGSDSAAAFLATGNQRGLQQ
jgi:hypothetical protein